MTEPTAEMLPFLADIRSAPADDPPRLALADWLDGHGYETWAELIRVQCELHAAPSQVIQYDLLYGADIELLRGIAAGDEDDLRILDLVERERACLDRPDDLPSFPAAEPMGRVDFDRGLHCLSLPDVTTWEVGQVVPSALTAASDLQFAWIDTMCVYSTPAAAIPGLNFLLGRAMRWAYVDALEERIPVPLARWRRMTNLGKLRRLSLSLMHQPDPRAALRSLILWPLPCLDDLTLYLGQDIDDRMAARLAEAPWPALEELQLTNGGMTTSGFVHLADRLGPRLRRLDAGSPMDRDVLQARCRHGLLASGGGYSRVKPASDWVGLLTACPNAAEMNDIAADGSELEDEDLLRLAESPHLRHVRSLGLTRTRVTDDGIAALTKTPMMGRLVELRLTGTAVGDSGIKALADCPAACRLEKLGLDGCQVTDTVALAIANSTNLRELWELFIQNIQLSPTTKSRLVERFGGKVYINK